MVHEPQELKLEYRDTYRSRVTIAAGLFDRLAEYLQLRDQNPSVVLITDATVWQLYGQRAVQQLSSGGRLLGTYVGASGETSKSTATLIRIWDQLAELGVDRGTKIVALGGGVVGDAAGMAAATYARGLDLIQIPTTLMAQVDSSLGGKVGINLTAGKNLVGCFWQPSQVLIDPTLLETMPDEEFHSGLAEVAKYAVILGEPVFSQWLDQSAALLRRDSGVLLDVIARCCRCKLDRVADDPLDRTGTRAVLNYGHTFGHAIENVYGYGTYTHGQAVAIGMSLAARLALRLGRVDQRFVERQTELLQKFQLPTELLEPRIAECLTAMRGDKKSLGGSVRFVLPQQLGKLELVEGISPDDVAAVFNQVAR